MPCQHMLMVLQEDLQQQIDKEAQEKQAAIQQLGMLIYMKANLLLAELLLKAFSMKPFSMKK